MGFKLMRNLQCSCRMLSQSPEVSRYDMSCLKILITGGGLLSATIRLEVMERIPTIKYVREAYGLNECGLVTLTYPREKKNSVSGSKLVEMPDDHVMPVGLPNMYTQVKALFHSHIEAIVNFNLKKRF